MLGLLTIGFSVAGVFAAMDFSDPSAPSTMETSWTDWVLGLIQLLITPFLLTGALVQVSKDRVSLGDFFRDVAYLKVLAVSIIQGLVYLVIAVVVALLAATIFIATNPPMAVIISVAVLLFLAVMLINPFFSFWSWYAADGNGIGESISQGFKAGKRNYLQVLLFATLGGLVVAIGAFITLGLGALILAPAMYLSMAHIYRQASGGELPAAS